MKLYAHQQKIIDEDPTKTGLFLGTGSGKTRTALLLARGRTLIIAPKTQVEDKNWEREYVGVMRNGLTMHCFITVISKETFRRDWEKLPAFDTVIVDEAHTCLGVTPNTRQRKRVVIPKASQLFEALDNYLHKHKPQRLYLCTATIMRSPMTVWGAAKLLGHYWDFYEFRAKFYTRLNMPGREVYSAKSDSDTKDRLANLVRSIGYVGRLEDFFDVPEQTFITKYIELTAKQKARLKALPLEYPEPIVLLGKKHQVENGVLAGDEFNEPESFENGKLDKIVELAAEFPKMIVFAKYRRQIIEICDALAHAGYTTTHMMGGSEVDRGQLLKWANKIEQCVLVVSAQISAGWELPEYPVMVFASCSYSFVDRVQAEGRIQRANNIKKNLYIDLVVKGGIDEAVQKAITNKKDFDERIYLNL